MTAFLDLRRRTLLFVVSSITLLEDPDYLTQALSPEHCMFFMVTEIKHVYASYSILLQQQAQKNMDSLPAGVDVKKCLK